MNARDRAVRNVLRVHEVGAGHVDDTPGVPVRFADRVAAGVDDGDAVDVERVAVGAGVDGADGELPHAVIPLGQGPLLPGVAGQVAAGQADFGGPGREDAGGDAAGGPRL